MAVSACPRCLIVLLALCAAPCLLALTACDADTTLVLSSKTESAVQFWCDPLEGQEPLTVTCVAFTADGQPLPEATYAWTFDDIMESGDRQTHSVRTHTFNSAGIHTVTLSLVMGGLSVGCLNSDTGTTEARVTVARARSLGCLDNADCDDGVECTDDTCLEGSCVYTANDDDCPDDGVFCNGTEFCDPVADCSHTGNPCPGQFCDENSDACFECLDNNDCDDGVGCTDDTCVDGSCVHAVNHAHCPDDGIFCNGMEFCHALADCSHTGDPCPGQVCDEDNDVCVPCLGDEDCDDGLYCNGEETCLGGTCQPGTPVDCSDDVGCTVDSCNEATDSCDNLPSDALCDNGLFCDGAETCDPVLDCQAGTDSCPGEPCDELSDSCAPYYVDKNNPSADDNNPGTEALPWKTLAKAASTAQAGDTVLVKAGTYYETLAPAHSGTPGAPIIFRSSPGVRPVIDGQFIRTNNVYLSGRSYVRVEGFEMIGSASNCVVIAGNGLEIVDNLIHNNVDSSVPVEDAGIVFGAGSGMLIQDNDIYDNAGNGLKGQGTSNTHNFTIRNNRIHHNGKDGIIDGSGSNWLLEFNWIYDHRNPQTHSDNTQFQRPVDGLIIRYNRFWNATQHIYIPDDVGPLGTYRNIEIYGNEIYHDNDVYPVYQSIYPKGIFVTSTRASSYQNVYIYNNTIVGCYFGINVRESIPGTFTGEIVVRNNIVVGARQFLTKETSLDWDTDYNTFFKNGQPGNILWDGTFYGTLAAFQAAYPTKDQHSLEANPEFADPAAFDHHLTTISPCVDAGDPNLGSVVPLPAWFLDIDHTVRPQDLVTDMGAYELPSD